MITVISVLLFIYILYDQFTNDNKVVPVLEGNNILYFYSLNYYKNINWILIFFLCF